MKVSIKDIADELQLSKATISWILSGQGKAKGFSETTIKRVQEYAASVGYRPNKLARSLSMGSSQMIGLIVPYLGDTFYAHLAEAIEIEAMKYNYSLVVANSVGDGAKEDELINNMRSMQMDGIVLATNRLSNIGITGMIDDNYPFVLIDRYFPELESNFVLVNNHGACHDMVYAMKEKGAKCIAFITADYYLYVMQERMEGYRQGVKELGLSKNPSLEVLVDRDSYKTDIITQLDKLFQEVPEVDGFFFATHYLAMEAIRYFIAHGIDYRKFTLGCFHETDGLDVLAPNMLISRMRVQEMGEQAIRIVIQNIKNKDEKPPLEHLVIENELRV